MLTNALLLCAWDNIRIRSQEVLKALASFKLDSELVWDCWKELNKLAENNKGHNQRSDNENAFSLKRKRRTSCIGSELVFWIFQEYWMKLRKGLRTHKLETLDSG